MCNPVKGLADLPRGVSTHRLRTTDLEAGLISRFLFIPLPRTCSPGPTGTLGLSAGDILLVYLPDHQDVILSESRLSSPPPQNCEVTLIQRPCQAPAGRYPHHVYTGRCAEVLLVHELVAGSGSPSPHAFLIGLDPSCTASLLRSICMSLMKGPQDIPETRV